MRSNEHYDRLSRIRDRYSNKRSLGYQLLDQCLDAIEAAITEHEVYTEGRFAALEQDRDRLRDRAEKQAAQVRSLSAQLDEKRKLTEARKAEGDEVRVTIDRSLGGWQVSDLEEVAYRLRCGGAVDDTPVKVSEYTATALVPAPDMVTLHRPAAAIQVDPPEHDYVVERDRRPIELLWGMPVGAAATLAVVLVMLGVLIGLVVP